MPIHTTCPGCQAKFQLGDHLAGKKVRCQKCKHVFTAPALASAPAETAPPVRVVVAPPVPPAAPPEPDEPFLAELLEPDRKTVQPIGPDDEETIGAAPVKSKAAPRRRASSLPQDSSGAGWVVAILVVFFATIAGAGIVAAVIVAINMDAQPKIMPIKKVADVRFPDKGFFPDKDMARDKDWWPDKDKEKAGDKEFGKDKDKGDNDKGGVVKPPPAPFLPDQLDLDGKVIVNSALSDGKGSFRVKMQAGKRYHFQVRSDQFTPQLEIHDVAGIVTVGQRSKQYVTTFLAQRTGVHTLVITPVASQPNFGTVFALSFAPERSVPPGRIEFGADDKFTERCQLRLSDRSEPLLPKSGEHGLWREYRLTVKPNEEYAFKIQAPGTRAMLFTEVPGVPRVEIKSDAPTGVLDYVLFPNTAGEAAIFVTTEKVMVMPLTLTVTRKVVPLDAEPRTVVFVNHWYRTDDRVTVDGPRDAGKRPANTYVVPMEAGFAYSMTQSSNAIDSYLTLTDATGKTLAENNEAAEPPDARILFEPRTSGDYRIHAANQRRQAGVYTLVITRFPIPKKEVVNRAFLVEKLKRDGAEIVSAALKLNVSGRYSTLWAPDGKAILILDSGRTLRRIRVPDFVEEEHISVDGSAPQILLAADGILCASQPRKEYWFIDPADLRLVKRFPTTTGGIHYVAPGQLTAFQVKSVGFKDSKPVGTILGHDLTGKSPPVVDGLQSNGSYAMSADGTFLYGLTIDGKLARWRNRDRKLVFEEAGDFCRGPSAHPPATLSADGRWLLRRFDRMQAPKDDVEPAPKSGFGWVVYRTDALARPAFVIDTDTRSMVAAVDPKSGHFYTHSPSKGLIVCDADGKILRTIGDTKNEPLWQLLVHPDGGRLVAFIGTFGTTKIEYIDLQP